MEQIKLIKIQSLSSAGSAVGASADSPASASAAIDKRLIADEVLGVRRGHRKGLGRIVKGKGKTSSTSYLTLSSRSQSQAAEQQRRFNKRLNAQQHEIDTLKAVIAQ